jgi:hypothetical protein
LNDDADLWVRTGEHVALPAEPPPAETGADAVEAVEGPVPPPSRARLLVGVGLVAVSCLLLGYLVGWTRGSADLDRGSGPTTSVVTLATPVASSTVPTTTAPAPTDPPAPGPELPPVEVTTFDFADGVPAEVDAAAGIEVIDGVAVAGPLEPLPDDQPKPRLLDAAPQIRASYGAEVTVASVRLVEPTARASLAFAIDGAAYWQLAVAPSLQQLVLYEVRDGTQQQRAVLDVAVTPGMAIGLFLVDGEVGITIDGATRQFRSFFGPEGSIDAAGIEGDDAAAIAGDGTTRFDDLTIG